MSWQHDLCILIMMLDNNNLDLESIKLLKLCTANHLQWLKSQDVSSPAQSQLLHFIKTHHPVECYPYRCICVQGSWSGTSVLGTSESTDPRIRQPIYKFNMAAFQFPYSAFNSVLYSSTADPPVAGLGAANRNRSRWEEFKMCPPTSYFITQWQLRFVTFCASAQHQARCLQ